MQRRIWLLPKVKNIQPSKNYQQMRLILFFVAMLATVFTIGCKDNNPQKKPAEKAVVDYFPAMDLADTMRFEVFPDGDTSGAVRIPTSAFFRKMPTRLMNEIQYFDNTAPLYVYARGRFPFAEGKEALLADLRQNWYQHQSLFIYDSAIDSITARSTVAEFYGGDGGQITTGSYLLDLDGDGDRDLVRREVERWIDTSGGEAVENVAHHVSVFHWQDGNFIEAPIADSAALIAAFPIQPVVGQ